MIREAKVLPPKEFLRLMLQPVNAFGKSVLLAEAPQYREVLRYIQKLEKDNLRLRIQARAKERAKR